MKKFGLFILAVSFLNLFLWLINSRILFPVKTQPLASSQKPVFFAPIYGQVVLHGPENEPKVALSFDADMTPLMRRELSEGKVASFYNEKIIEILEAEKTPATLFLAGLWAEAYPEVTKKLSENPLFEIGNHSYSHPAFSRPCFNLQLVAETQKEEEIKLAQESLSRITGQSPKLFRFPGGCFSPDDVRLANKYGLTVVHWNVDGRDAFNTDKEKILAAVKKESRPGSILIFHLHGGRNAPMTAEALPEVIHYLRSQGYTLVKVGELLRGLSSESR